MDLTIATTIKNQIGNKALCMMGAKNLAGNDHALTFQIGNNSKRINWIEISLNYMDLYDIKFIRMRKYKCITVKECNDIYFDQLHSIIEKHTGLYLSL